MNLSTAEISATVATNDLNRAKQFYGDTLGLKQAEENQAGVGYRGATGLVFVYQSDTAGSGKATAANFNVTDIAAVAAELKNKGVEFEHYDIPNVKWEGDVAVMGPMKMAWLKDPDGNILGITQMSQ